MAKILVIDDSEDLCSVLSAQLSRAHHSTETAGNGEEGLSRCEREPFDLVLLDIWMPKVDGITALKILRERWPNLPVIVMSGGSNRTPLEYSVALAEAHGATAVLFKPFSQKEMLAKVEDALAEGS